MIEVRTCEGCSREFMPSRPDQHYCSSKCWLRLLRQKRYIHVVESTGTPEALGDPVSVTRAPTLERHHEKQAFKAAPPPRSDPVFVKVRGVPRRLDYIGVLHKAKFTKGRGQHHAVTIGGVLVVEASTDAEFDACRVLAEMGLAGGIGFRHEGDAIIGLVTTITRGAELTAAESRARGPHFARWKPFGGIDADDDGDDEDEQQGAIGHES